MWDLGVQPLDIVTGGQNQFEPVNREVQPPQRPPTV